MTIGSDRNAVDRAGTRANSSEGGEIEARHGSLRLTLPYPPSANRYWRIDRRGFAYTSAEAKAYKSTVSLLVKATASRRQALPLTGPLSVYLMVYRPRRAGDLDNLFKVPFDALNGSAWVDDSQVKEIGARIGDDKENPRVEVEVRELP